MELQIPYWYAGIPAAIQGLTPYTAGGTAIFSEFHSSKSLGLLLQKLQWATTLQSGCTESS